MSNKKSRRQQQQDGDDDSSRNALTKEETQVARFLRLSCAHKTGNLQGMGKVQFFYANKLVDALLEAKQFKQLFATRQAAVAYMQRLMNKELFHRAYKIYKDEEESTTSAAAADTSATSSGTPSATTRRRKNKAAAEQKEESEQQTEEEPSPKAQQQPSKRKFKLDIHENQVFVDANEPYVWIYDPTTTKSFVIGLALVLGSIGVCCFPLWPSFIRDGVYYLSLAGAGFLGSILGLAAFKYVLYACIYAISFGTVSFWLFPNLTEDVGFFESFVPVYAIGDPKATAKKAVTSSSSSSTAESTASSSAKEATPKATPRGAKAAKAGDEIEDEFELVGDDELVKKQEAASSAK